MHASQAMLRGLFSFAVGTTRDASNVAVSKPQFSPVEILPAGFSLREKAPVYEDAGTLAPEPPGVSPLMFRMASPCLLPIKRPTSIPRPSSA